MIQRVLARKDEIDADLERMTQAWRREWEKEYTSEALTVLATLIEFIHRGGKRLRGGLAMESYYLHGGKNKEIALGAARVMELIQAYLLIMDDIQDRSVVRRGGPAVHVQLATDHDEHYGIAQGMNAEILASHQAMIELVGLPFSDSGKIRALQILNHNISITVAGQINDIFNQTALGQVDEATILKAYQWKTAYYTFVSPLELGACLAGADKLDDQLRSYAVNAGIAFQISDDILGVFGNTKVLGKSANDDIREGKATLIATYAYNHATQPQLKLLKQCLGNPKSTDVECDRIREIFEASGAHAYAAGLAREYAFRAEQALGDSSKQDLVELVRFAVNRTK